MIFNSGFNFGPNVEVTMSGNRSQCPRCGSMQNLPDGKFRVTVEGLIRAVKDAPDRLKAAQDLLEVARQAQVTGDLAEVRKTELNNWLPSEPANAIGYLQILIGVLQVILQLLLNNPETKIEYNQTFINNYNTVSLTAAPRTEPPKPTKPKAAKPPSPQKQKVGRNDPCPCGSAKKFKKCHGKSGS